MNNAFKNLAKNVGTYLNIYEVSSSTDSNVTTLESYINWSVEEVTNKLKVLSLVPVVIGDGSKIIDQYPIKGTSLIGGNKVFLLTNSAEYKMPDITKWSRSEVDYFTKLTNLNVKYEGYGYVKSYNIKPGTILKKEDMLEVVLESKYEKK